MYSNLDLTIVAKLNEVKNTRVAPSPYRLQEYLIQYAQKELGMNYSNAVTTVYYIICKELYGLMETK